MTTFKVIKGSGGKGPADIVSLQPAPLKAIQGPAYLRRNLKMAEAVLVYLANSRWRNEGWHTKETAFAIPLIQYI